MSATDALLETPEAYPAAGIQDTFTITQLAGEFGVTSRTIRFYEDKELLQPSRSGMNRIYSRRDRARLALVLRGKRLGFSLSDVKDMLDLYDLRDGQVEQMKLAWRKCGERVAMLRGQQDDLARTITELEDGRRQIEAALAERGETPPGDDA